MLKKPFIARRGKQAFLDNYANDGLLPLPGEQRAQLPNLEGCIACGLCDTVCPRLPAATRHLFNGPSALACSLTRELPAYKLNRAYLELWHECGDCRECESACPAGVPLREVATFTRAMINVLEGDAVRNP
jgi:succinate dehydrogenase/fumarate reductase-like Fe-S protein